MTCKFRKTKLFRSISAVTLSTALTAVPACAGSYSAALNIEYSGMLEEATLQVYDDQNQPVWSLTSSSPAMQLSQYALLESDDDIVYFVDYGIVTAYDAATGSVLWTNTDFGGSVAMKCYVIEDGSVYVSGYYGPDYCLIAPDGTTISRVDTLNEGVYWPYAMTKDENGDIHITFESDENTYTVQPSAYVDYVEEMQVLGTLKRGTPLEVVNCNESISLRNMASGQGEVIQTMPLGSTCTFLYDAGNGFYFVHYTSGSQSVNGFANADYLSE